MTQCLTKVNHCWSCIWKNCFLLPNKSIKALKEQTYCNKRQEFIQHTESLTSGTWWPISWGGTTIDRPACCSSDFSSSRRFKHAAFGLRFRSAMDTEYKITNTPPSQPFYGPFLGPPRWASARRELLECMVQGKINRGRHTDHPAGRLSIRTNQCPPPLYPHFLQAGCPSCRPTMLKHWRQLVHSD